MPTKKQHYVPRVYLKSWEAKVETTNEPTKKFDGVYFFEDGATVGEGRTIEAILWEPHIYTISFRQLYIADRCPKVYSHFVDKVYEAMIHNCPKPVYGKLGYSVIRNKQSVQKHLRDIDKWEFYYIDDNSLARKNAIINRLDDMNCYIIEDSFDRLYETRWESILRDFVNEVQSALPVPGGSGERMISEEAAKNMMEFFFMMLCRSPQFDAMGIYTWISDILKQAFGAGDEVDDFMDAIWFAELYSMFFKNQGGFYNTALSMSVDKLQFILFEAYPGAGTFITSDNPAFQHISHVETTNMNGYCFPISPQHFLFIAKGSEPVNFVDYRMADRLTVKKFNQIVASHSKKVIVASEKIRQNLY
ncbi:MAG: DUF4238 domain-containing protein [Clostridia bacterium]|nr:DUF4238 domain-containing protein [Clostridia bacterium]